MIVKAKARIKIGLTPDEFERLLARLDRDRELAAESYEVLRRKLIKFFDWSDCAAPEECTDETLDRVARRLTAREPIEDLTAFVWGVARNLRHESRKRSSRTVQIDGIHDDDGRGEAAFRTEDGPQQELENQEQLQRLQKCLSRLAEPERVLFLEYHDPDSGKQEQQRQKLADSLGISIGALRVRVNRLREKLEKCVARDRSWPGKKN